MVRTGTFTSHMAGFQGTAPYFTYPNPQPPSTRSGLLMGIQGYPITAPQPGRNTANKAGVDPQLVGFQSTALTPQGPVTYSNYPGAVGYVPS